MTLPASAFLLSYHALSLVDLSCHNTGKSQCFYPQCVRYSSKTTGAVQSSRKTSDGRRNLCPASGWGRSATPGRFGVGVPAKLSPHHQTLPGQKVPVLGPWTREGGTSSLGLLGLQAAAATTVPSGVTKSPGCARAPASSLSNLRSCPVVPTHQFPRPSRV